MFSFLPLSWWWNRIKTRRVNCNGRIHKTDSIFKADWDFLSCCVNIFSIRISEIILKPTPKMITILFWLEIIERNGRRKSIEICLQELKFIIYWEVNTIHLFTNVKSQLAFYDNTRLIIVSRCRSSIPMAIYLNIFGLNF